MGKQGGRRPGAGRKPGSMALREALKVDTKEIDITTAQIAGMGSDDKHRLYCSLEARGMSNKDICKALDMAERTGHYWRGADWHSILFKEEIDKLKDDVFSAFVPMLPLALQTYTHHLTLQDKEIAGDVIDRIYGKPSHKDDTTPDQTFLVKFEFHGSPPAKVQVIEGESRELPPLADTDYAEEP